MNVKALVGTFNQEEALGGAFSVIVKTGCGTEGALHSTTFRCPLDRPAQPGDTEVTKKQSWLLQTGIKTRLGLREPGPGPGPNTAQLRPSDSPHKNWKVSKLCLRLLTYKWYWSP